MSDLADRMFQKLGSGVAGQIGSAERCTTPQPQREPAKFVLKRKIRQLREASEETQRIANQLEALHHELPEQLSQEADDALYDLLKPPPKPY